MRTTAKRQTSLSLPIDGLVPIAVAMPNDEERDFVVPVEWLGVRMSEKLPATLSAVRAILTRRSGGTAADSARDAAEASIRKGLVGDRDAVLELLAGMIARRLLDTYVGSVDNRGERKRPSAAAAFAASKSLAEDIHRDQAYLGKLSRWLSATISAWEADDERWEADLMAKRLAYLIALQAQEVAKPIAELMAPPHRPIDYLESLLGIAGSPPAEVRIPSIPNGTLVVLSTGHFQGLREALYKNTFRRIEGTPWPTAPLARSGGHGFAQLRPAVMDSEPLLPEKQVDTWVQTMWRQQSELSDLDADALDALCAIYLHQAREPDDAAVADVDEILAMRGLKPKRGGQGRRGGFEPEQRSEMLRALSHIQNLWIDIGEVQVVEREAAGRSGRRLSTKTLQSRPFIITDRMGQVRLDGYMDVERFIFRPGKAFAAFLFGSGRHLGLLFQKALQYDPMRRKWEKRLTRFLSWQWRANARGGDLATAYRVSTLLEAVGGTANDRYPAKTRDRLEKALTTLKDDDVIAEWRYVTWTADAAPMRGWIADWMAADLTIEAPAPTRAYYANLRQGDGVDRLNPVVEPARDLASRIRRHRRALGMSQTDAALRLGIQQGHFSKLERGQVRPSSQLSGRIEAWLGE